MAKCIKTIERVRLTEIWRLNPNDTAWERRLRYLNAEGSLEIYESENLFPGKYFCILGGFFRTGCGNYIINDEYLAIKTKNSIYRFTFL